MTEIQSINLNQLTLLEKNPRKIDKIQFDKLCRSLQDDPGFLNDRPVLVNKVDGKLFVYAGNQRVRAARKLGWKDIPCIIEEGLSEDIIKSRTIKDNAHYGEFDYDMLANEFDMEMLFDAGLLAEDFGLEKESIEDISKENPILDHETCAECGQKIKSKKGKE